MSDGFEMVTTALVVDHSAAAEAIERCGGRAPGNPEVDIILSESNEAGLATLTIDGPGAYHSSPEIIATALGLQKQPEIKKHTPSTLGMVVSEPGRPPSPAAARASAVPKGRKVVPKPGVERPAEQADLVTANPPSTTKSRRGSK